MPADGMRDILARAGTPGGCKGALGTWSVQESPDMEGRGTLAHPGKSTAMGRGVCGAALQLHLCREGDRRGRPGSAPDGGNPTVRDRRGAWETWLWWNCDPTPYSKEREWKPSTYGACTRVLSRPLSVPGPPLRISSRITTFLAALRCPTASPVIRSSLAGGAL